jgi:hypothetical protein
MNPKQLKRIPKAQKTSKGKITPKLLTREDATQRIACAVAPLARLAATTDPLVMFPPRRKPQSANTICSKMRMERQMPLA